MWLKHFKTLAVKKVIFRFWMVQNFHLGYRKSFKCRMTEENSACVYVKEWNFSNDSFSEVSFPCKKWYAF